VVTLLNEVLDLPYRYAEHQNKKHFHFTSSSLKKAIEGVLVKDVVDQKAGKYYFQDPLFEYWLSKQ